MNYKGWDKIGRSKRNFAKNRIVGKPRTTTLNMTRLQYGLIVETWSGLVTDCCATQYSIRRWNSDRTHSGRRGR